jgi:hypothetical protein
VCGGRAHRTKLRAPRYPSQRFQLRVDRDPDRVIEINRLLFAP